MKLSELVAYRNELRATTGSSLLATANIDINKFLESAKKITIGDYDQQLLQSQQCIEREYAGLGSVIEQLKQSLDGLIRDKEDYWYKECSKLYPDSLIHDSPEYLLNRRLFVNEETNNTVIKRMQSYTNWQHAGMIIRPGLEPFIKHLVSFDPLYLVDQSHTLLFPAMLEFPEQYQRKLRPYFVNELEPGPFLHSLPNNQFGFCFAWNYFNFKPIEVIEKYLNELYAKLKPGGILLFTFNDCDRESAVKLVEHYYCTYTPGTRVRQIAADIGFEESFSLSDVGPSTLLELRKPGELTSIRGGSTVAKIMIK